MFVFVMRDPFSNYDNWLQKDNPAEIPDIPDEGYCPHCGEEMECEADVDVCEETGRAFVCGGNWICTNRNCPPEKEEEAEEE